MTAFTIYHVQRQITRKRRAASLRKIVASPIPIGGKAHPFGQSVREVRD